MNLKVISINVGRALLVSALFMFLSLVVSIVNGMDSSFGPLAISFIITFIFGSFPFIFVRSASAISIKEGYFIIILSWLLSFIFGMLPYVLWGEEFTLVNAWFESVSGYTTTGATILDNVEGLPRGLLFWRSSTHFIGGLGIVAFLLLVLPSASPLRFRLTNMDMSSLSREGYGYRSMRAVYVILAVYVGMFICAAFSFFFAGMSPFDAINHGFSVVATGGFSTKNMSVSYYDSMLINMIATFFMLLSSLHYGLIFASLVTRSFRPIFKQPTVKYYFCSIAVMTLLITVSLKLHGNDLGWGRATADSFFMVCNYVTSTGFGTSDNSTWPFIAGIVLLFASLQGGCAGSTTGGLKVDRFYIAARAVAQQIRSNIHPGSVSKVRVGGHYVDDRVAMSAILYILLHCTIIIIGIFLLLMCGVDIIDAISGSVASMGNIGPGLGDIGSFSTYAAQPAAAKVIYTLEMILGRTEIYPVLVVVSLIFKGDK